MSLTQTTRRIHPLMAGAAVSVTLVSLLGVAALTGLLPNSHALSADAVHSAALAPATHSPSVVPTHAIATGRRNATVYAQAPIQVQPQVQQPQVTSQSAPAPVARNSPVGIGLGAVIGGVLGSQVGSGDGKTLATIAGAIGGGYIGNEVAKRNP